MKPKLDSKTRYLQIAFNHDLGLVRQILPKIPYSPRILIEAGTPFIKREGMKGIRHMRRMWRGHLVADMKVTDGAEGEVALARQAGADMITVMGNSSTETLNKFLQACDRTNMISMIDLLGVDDPLDTVRRLDHPPDVMVLHHGRDEESTRGKQLEYRHIRRIHTKYDVNISAAGGVGLREARSAIFNGVNIVVVNLVRPGDPWKGVSVQEDIAAVVNEFLTTIA